MYNILLIAQIIAVGLCLFCTIMLIVQKNTEISKYMLLTCICSFIENAGYLLEMRSTNISEAMMAVQFEYVGATYVLTCMVFFVCTYCKIDLPKLLKLILFGLGTVVLASVWFYQYTDIYYLSVDFVSTGIFPHLVLKKGLLYIVYNTIMVVEFISCIAISLITCLKTSDPNMRRNYKLLTICCAIPSVVRFINLFDVFEGYDPVPISVAIGVLSFVFAIAFKHIFDVVDAAHDRIMMEMDEAVVILDYRYGFQEANNKAKKMFPFLESVATGELIQNEIFEYAIENRGCKNILYEKNFYDVLFNEVQSKSQMVIGYTLVFADITESKKQLDRLTELMEAADAANQAKSAFLASVSHEIRTPINVVVGMSDVIIRDYKDEKLKEYAENIQNAGSSLLNLINDILDFSKIESGGTELVEKEYDVNRFFVDIISAYSHKGDDKGIEFITKIDEKIPAVMCGDETRIRQIMTNLLSNAFKYTNEGSVTFKASFERRSEDSGNLIITVEDTGIGIKKSDMDNLFGVFVRLDEEVNRAVEGAGLGLNITKQLLDLMEGQIKVVSEYGKGSKFCAIIPQKVGGDANSVVGEISKPQAINVERKAVDFIAPEAKVLVVDDSKTNLIVAKALLRDTKVEITTAKSGFECLDIVREKKFDVIFLDHRMPEMDGVETLHRMHTMDKSTRLIPSIMLTANAANDARAYYLNEGFADFITKPITEESIVTILKKYLPKEKIIDNK